MLCHQIAERIEELEPLATPTDVARLCLLLYNQFEDPEILKTYEDEAFLNCLREVDLMMQSAVDQHSAVTQELDHSTDEILMNLSTQHLGMFLRALKVQTQVLSLYVGMPQELSEESPEDFF